MEEACLRLVAQRLSSKEIAEALSIAKTSVDTYCDRARAKLGAADRYEATRLAGLASLGPLLSVTEERRRGDMSGARRARPRAAYLGAACLLVAPIAAACLIAGLRALDEMRPVDWPRAHALARHLGQG